MTEETDIGRLRFAGNELLVDSTVEDPPGVRLGAPAAQRGLGKFSGDILGENGHRHEVVLVQFKQTGDHGIPDGRRGGELYLGLALPDAGSTDGAMVDVLTATVEGGIQFLVPIHAPNLTGGPGVTPWYLESPDGRYRTYQQDDGNLVTYDQQADGGPKAVWSSWHGKL